MLNVKMNLIQFELFFYIIIFILNYYCDNVIVLRRRYYYVTPQPRIRRTPAIPEGKLRLVGGQYRSEGNIEIYHLGRWGSICDDEWDMAEAQVACKSLGFHLGAIQATNNGFFGRGRKLIWMDNLYCNGNETSLTQCPFDGWNVHDCTSNEVAGVICETKQSQDVYSNNNYEASTNHRNSIKLINDEPIKNFSNAKLKIFTKDNINIRLFGGRTKLEGRIEINVNGKWNGWRLVCGDGWSLLEAMVVCRQLGFGYAHYAVQSSVFGGTNLTIGLSGVQCKGYEQNIADCNIKSFGSVYCPGKEENIAGVMCTHELPDLVIDEKEIESSSHLEDRPLLFLQCAMEENCLSSSAYNINKNDYGWLFEQRRLLRFTARIGNIGNADFRPFLPKSIWDWHACHRHYHSMEVFAHFDILNHQGKRVAEGHKASFCLEDNNCEENVIPKYACANYGDQGISVGCTDTYLHNIDCQWIDITDLPAGTYQFKVSINPEFKVSEISFDNNAALCTLYYDAITSRISNCTLVRP